MIQEKVIKQIICDNCKKYVRTTQLIVNDKPKDVSCCICGGHFCGYCSYLIKECIHDEGGSTERYETVSRMCKKCLKKLTRRYEKNGL